MIEVTGTSGGAGAKTIMAPQIDHRIWGAMSSSFRRLRSHYSRPWIDPRQGENRVLA